MVYTRPCTSLTMTQFSKMLTWFTKKVPGTGCVHTDRRSGNPAIFAGWGRVTSVYT